MCSKAELSEIEDALKSKYTDIIKGLSHLELKAYSQEGYKKLVKKELKQLVPDLENIKLEVMTQCISNTLRREAKAQLNKRSREKAAQSTSAMLSKTVIEELDITMREDTSHQSSREQVEESSYYDTDDDDDVSNDDETLESESCILNSNNKSDLNDSITCLKQLASSVNEPQSSTNATSTPSETNSKGQQLFCETCNSKPSQVLQNDISILTDDVTKLKDCTQSVLSAVKDLSNRFESCIEGINDRLISLRNQISSRDKSIGESIETLTSSTNTLKNNLEKKSTIILNKTNAVLDKVKSQAVAISKANEDPKPKPNTNQEVKKSIDNKQKTGNIRKPEDNKMKTDQQSEKPKYRNVKSKSKSPIQSSQELEDHYISHKKSDNEIIDLTHVSTKELKKHIRQSTLLVGSSLLKGVRVSDLKPNTTVRTFPGARVDTIVEQLSKYNIEDCKTIILHVGGNDADSGIDLNTFSDNYVTLLNTLSAEDRSIIVSGLIPRETVDLKPYNEMLKSICDENNIKFIDNYDNFLLASGEMCTSFFQNDKLHLNISGTKRFLTNINKVIGVTNSSPYSNKLRLSHGYRQNQNASNPARSQKYCHICTRKGHSTHDCWFNGRGTPRSGFNYW